MRDPTSTRALALLLLIVGLAWIQVVTLGWCWDDQVLVVEHPMTGDPSRWGEMLRLPLWHSVGIEGPPYYRPLVLLSFGIDAVLSGPAPWFAHAHGLAWHLAAVAALWGLLRQLRPGWPALAGAALYALHPLQTEAVAFTVARNDAMAAALGLGGLALLLPRRVSTGRLLGGGVLFLLALLAKESVVLLPAGLLLLDLARFRRPGGMTRYLALGLPVVAVAALRAALGVPDSRLPTPASLQLLLERSPDLLGTLGGLLVVPWPLSAGRHLVYLDPPVTAVVGGLAAVALVAVLLVRRGGAVAGAGLVLGLLCLAPGAFAIAGTLHVMERYASLSLAGLAIALTAAWPDTGVARRLGLAVAAAWIVVINLALPAWRGDGPLFTAAAERTPSAYTLYRLGAWQLEAGQHAAAFQSLDQSLRWPDQPRYPGSCVAAMQAAVYAGARQPGAALAHEAQGCDDPEALAWQAAVLGFVQDWEGVQARVEAGPLPEPAVWRPAAGARAEALGLVEEAAAMRQQALSEGVDPDLYDRRVRAMRGG